MVPVFLQSDVLFRLPVCSGACSSSPRRAFYVALEGWYALEHEHLTWGAPVFCLFPWNFLHIFCPSGVRLDAVCRRLARSLLLALYMGDLPIRC